MTEATVTSPMRLGPLAVPTRWIRAHLKQIDFVLVALAVLFAVLYLYSPDQAFHTVRYVASELAQIGPWLLGSVIVAAVAKATGADSLAARAFRGRQSRMIVVASLIGALLPFCSCGVIPLVAGLLGAGVPLAPVMAFWISSPLMDPTQFFIAAGTLGTGFAVAKMVSAVGMGMLSGFGTMFLIRVGWLDAPASVRIASNIAPSCCGPKPIATVPAVPKSCCGSTAQTITVAEGSCCGPKPLPPATPIAWRFWSDPTRSQKFF